MSSTGECYVIRFPWTIIYNYGNELFEKMELQWYFRKEDIYDITWQVLSVLVLFK